MFLLKLFYAEKIYLQAQVPMRVPIFEVVHIYPGTAMKFYFYAVIDDALSKMQKYVKGE